MYPYIQYFFVKYISQLFEIKQCQKIRKFFFVTLECHRYSGCVKKINNIFYVVKIGKIMPVNTY